MKADRLTRKTYLKKNNVRPDGEITLYDLTDNPAADANIVSLHEISYQAAASIEQITARPDSFETQDDILSWCAALMAQSPAARVLWQDAESAGWRLGLADLHNSGFHLDVVDKTLLLDHFALAPKALGRSSYFRNTLLLTFVRALREIWHEDRCEPFEIDYAPEDALMMERVRAADSDTVTVLAAWELRGAGFADIWRHLIGSAEGDMALIFTKFLERDPSALFDGSALTYAFRQWYADQTRVDGCDHEALEALDDILLESGEPNPFGTQQLQPGALESLATLPDGTCYLRGLGETILHDSFFAGLRDEINQTHLFQIMYDMEVTMVNNVPFRDRILARKFFPHTDSGSVL